MFLSQFLGALGWLVTRAGVAMPDEPVCETRYIKTSIANVITITEILIRVL
jgi:hypothetical protein